MCYIPLYFRFKRDKTRTVNDKKRWKKTPVSKKKENENDNNDTKSNNNKLA